MFTNKNNYKAKPYYVQQLSDFSDGRQNYTLRLSSLSIPHNETRGWLLVMIPYNRDDPNNYYTIELRTARSFDKGILQVILS